MFIAQWVKYTDDVIAACQKLRETLLAAETQPVSRRKAVGMVDEVELTLSDFLAHFELDERERVTERLFGKVVKVASDGGAVA